MASQVVNGNEFMHQLPRFERDHALNVATGEPELHDPNVPAGYAVPDVEAVNPTDAGSTRTPAVHVGADPSAAAMGAVG